ncbi:MAG: hypothetical protein J0H43_11295, partial [Actinobacteria bacterium]|nr:hypothetical protein [Actinomycetota bacterium]
PPPWRAAPAAWQAVQDAYAPFDDGTKTTAMTPDAAPPDSDTSLLDHAPGGSSPVLTWAITLHDALRAATTAQPTVFNAVTGAVAPGWSPRPDDLAQTVTVLRAVSNGLPELAVLLRIGTDDWHTQQTLYAPERRLTSYEHRNLAVTSTTRVVHPEVGDLDELRASLRHAENLSLSLSVQLARTRPELGTNPQPALVILHAQALDPATVAAAARSALRRAAADTPSQWHSRRQAPPPPARSSPAR